MPSLQPNADSKSNNTHVHVLRLLEIKQKKRKNNTGAWNLRKSHCQCN